MLDRIKIRGPLRCEGVGRLDCAEEISSGRRLAVRWIPIQANADAYSEALHTLPVHPSLPQILHVGGESDCLYAVIDFPEGRLLSATVGESLTGREVARMGNELSGALAAIHGRSLWHGELSVHSILRGRGGANLLWDFPLVLAERITDRRRTRTPGGTLEALVPCLAPELARGGAPTASSDVYALGAALCFAAGAPLPPSGSAFATLHRLATGEWAPQPPPNLPAPLRRVLSQMLDRDPKARPTSATAARAFETWETAPLEEAPPLPANAETLLVPKVAAVRAPSERGPLAIAGSAKRARNIVGASVLLVVIAVGLPVLQRAFSPAPSLPKAAVAKPSLKTVETSPAPLPKPAGAEEVHAETAEADAPVPLEEVVADRAEERAATAEERPPVDNGVSRAEERPSLDDRVTTPDERRTVDNRVKRRPSAARAKHSGPTAAPSDELKRPEL